MTGGPVVEFLLWGPVEVRANGRALAVGRPQQRAVLAALLVDAGRPVPVDVLVDRVWGQAQPQGARRMLHTHVTRIRRLLGEPERAPERTRGQAARLVRYTGGYLLDVDPQQVDVHRFRRLIDQSRDARRTDGERVALLREALSLVRGEPLADVPGPWAERVRESWRQWRLDAVLAWAGAEVHVGNHEVVIAPLTDLVRDHPLVEPLAATLMRALHAAGRAAEALDCYARVREHLADQLGTDPGTELQALHQVILRGDREGVPRPDPGTAAPAAVNGRAVTGPGSTSPGSTGAGSVGPGLAVPAQLPADVPAFAGRTDQLRQLDALLADGAGATGRPAAVVLTAVSGTAGVGKTCLVVHWAHRVANRFPDGQLYVNLRGFDPGGVAMQPAEALREFLDALGVPAHRVPAAVQAQAALYRSLLAGRRVLVVLDNARDAEQVRPLLPGSTGTAVVVTSRNRLASLVAVEGACPVTVDLLSVDEAREVLAARLGADRVAAEPHAVDAIIACCARLPLALAIVAARAALRPEMTLRALAAELRDCAGGLDAFAGEDAATDVRAVLSWSYETLSGPAARLFRLLGLQPGPDTSAAAAASLAGLPPREADRVLAELTRANMVFEPVTGRFTLHDLLRGYAAELARADPDPSPALHRLLDHYLHSAYAADRKVNPQRDPVILPAARPGVTTVELTGSAEALAWFSTEHPVLLAVVELAVRERCDTHTWLLAWTLAPFFDRRGHYRDWETVNRRALEAVRRLDDRSGQAYTQRSLARVCTRLGRFGDAHVHFRQALDLYVKLGDRIGQAHTYQNLAEVLESEARVREALEHTRQAHEIYRAAGHLSGQGATLNAIGWYLAQLDRHQEALDYCARAVAIHHEIGDRRGEADAMDSLGYAYRHLGDHDRAVTCYQRSVELFREAGDRPNQVMALTNLGSAYEAAGEPGRARAAWQRAVEVLDQLGQDADQLRTRLRDLEHRHPST